LFLAAARCPCQAATRVGPLLGWSAFCVGCLLYQPVFYINASYISRPISAALYRPLLVSTYFLYRPVSCVGLPSAFVRILCQPFRAAGGLWSPACRRRGPTALIEDKAVAYGTHKAAALRRRVEFRDFFERAQRRPGWERPAWSLWRGPI